MTTSGNISITSFWDRSAFYACPKIKKNRRKLLTQKKTARKVSKPSKTNFSVMTFLSSINFLTTWDSFFHHDFKISINMNKYIKTTKFLRKPVVSTPLHSIGFSERQWKRSMGAWVMPRSDVKNVCHWQFIDTISYYIKSLTKKTTTNTGKNQKKTVEKCMKKVSKQFKS